ncbi:hypothetical protein FKW77_008718 [Venturia effusa]|uniref:Uncharacterized protein n=1 Tax=Venturia effusa TaxID=50376 RepID=A0A517LHS6_9PEZI|nr:hypothetical protein FKW77_008718 [Venturia effusa]
MLRSKSPFKKKSPKESQQEAPPPSANPTQTRGRIDSNQLRAPTNPNQTPPDDVSRPPLRQWGSVQEFQEYQERHLLQGNAFAQKNAVAQMNAFAHKSEMGGRSGTPNELEPFPESPMTVMGQFMEAGRRDSTTPSTKTPQTTLVKTPKKKKKAAPPPLNLAGSNQTKSVAAYGEEELKLVPDGAEYAVPTQREKNESTRHKQMEDMMYDAIVEGNEPVHQSLTVDLEKIKRPKSPGKKFIDFFKGAASPRLPDTPEIPANYKAAKVLGKESLGKKKGKAIAAAQKKLEKEGFDFKCSGPTPKLGVDAECFDAPTDLEIRMSAEHTGYSPTDLEIRKVGGRGTIVSLLSDHRTVSDTATLVGARAAAINAHDNDSAAKYNSEIFLRTKSLQYMNDSLPPTPPSKESIFKTRARTNSNRALVTDYPPRSISTVPEDEDSDAPDTPGTAILISSPTPVPPISMLPRGLAKFARNDYADLILNNRAVGSFQASIGGSSTDSSSVNSESISAQFAGRSRNGSGGSLAPTIADSLGGRDGLGISGPGFSPSARSLSRRWSEGSLLTQAQAQKLGVPEVLKPGFYTPVNFQVEGFKPSRNRDTSVFTLPKVSPTDQNTRHQSSESLTSKRDPPSATAIPSSGLTSDQVRSASYAIGLGLYLSPLLANALENMGAPSDQSPGSDVPASFPNGHPSAVPAPLRFSQQHRPPVPTANGAVPVPKSDREELRSPLPADQTLDAYLVLHNHIDHSQWHVQESITRAMGAVNKNAVKMHEEHLKQMNAMYSDVMDKIKAIENDTLRTAEGIDRYKSEVTGAIEALGTAMQKNLVKPMDKMFQINTSLTEKIDSLHGRIEGLEKHVDSNTHAISMVQSSQRLSAASLDCTSSNPYEGQQGQVSSGYGNSSSHGPTPGLPQQPGYPGPYYFGGTAYPTSYTGGGHSFNHSVLKDFDRGQRPTVFGQFGEGQLQATSGSMQNHSGYRGNNNSSNPGHGQG